MTTFLKCIKTLLSLKKQEFNSIEIIVLDKSAEMAANIANEFLPLLDVVVNIRKNRTQRKL